VINSALASRPETALRRMLVRACLAAIILLTLLIQVAVAGVPGRVRTELVSTRMLPIATVAGTRIVPDLAAAGQILVRTRPGISRTDVQSMLAATDTSVLRVYDDGRLLLLKLPAGQSVTGAVARFNARPEVRLASPDRLMYPQGIPNDMRYGEQWHWPLIQAPQAWDLETGNQSAVVAVIDSGVDLDHPDLLDRIWTNDDEILGDYIDNDGNGYVDDVVGWNFVERNNNPMPVPDGQDEDESGSPDENVSHGTHAAGLIGAVTNNIEGVAGLDWACRIMALKVVPDDADARTSDCLAAIEYAVANGANVIYIGVCGAYEYAYTPVIAEAVAAGVTVVAPTANIPINITDGPTSWWSPICNDGDWFTHNNVIGVSATDSDDVVAGFSMLDGSSYNFVDVMAPGANVLSTLYYNLDLPELGFISPYGAYSGSSGAAAIVAGVASLVHARYPDYTPAGITEQIRVAADNIDEQNPNCVGRMGAGRVNAFNCLRDIPPQLPKTVTAYDTPDDNGGSITVEWSLSPDDGKGFNDVVGYRVQRSETGEEGSFTTLASPAAGVTSYVDSSVDDNKPYYYRIGVRDASTERFTDPTLPVQARDDTAPPALEEDMLVARVYGQDGGAISLSWSDYTPPGDFGAYRVWRSGVPFTNVSGLAQPIKTIGSSQQKSYIDQDDPGTPEKELVDGKEYYYAVTVQDREAEPNEITDVNCVGPVVANPIFSFSFPPGLSMIAIGVVPHNNNMGAIFEVDTPADLPLARWDPELDNGGEYVIYSEAPNSTFLQQQLGRGFWYRNPAGKELNISGSPAPAGDFSVDFVPGWNQLGNPYTQDMPIAQAKVTVFGTQMDLATSNSIGYTRDYMWRYAPSTRSYKLISAYMDFARDNVPKSEGFYFLAFENGKLHLPRPVAAAALAAPVSSSQAAVDQQHWSLRLVAQAGEAADTDNFIGVNPRAEELSGVVSPPPLDGAVELAVATSGGNYSATSFVESLGNSHTWQLSVTAAEPKQSVRLTWPDLSQVPVSCRLTLTDLEAGRSVNMRTTTSYSYQLGSQQSQRRFEVVITERGASALTVSGLQAMATGGDRAQVCFTLSQDAAVELEVLNISGRRVRTLAADRLLPAGSNVVLWDQRSDNGTLVPQGRYLICIAAKTDDGSVAKAIGTLQIQR